MRRNFYETDAWKLIRTGIEIAGMVAVIVLLVLAFDWLGI